MEFLRFHYSLKVYQLTETLSSERVHFFVLSQRLGFQRDGSPPTISHPRHNHCIPFSFWGSFLSWACK